MRTTIRILLGAGAVMAAGLSAAQARDLTVVGFGGAIQDAFREAYFVPFGKQNGITVLEDTTNGGLAKQKAMLDAGNVTWDVMQMEDDEITMACDQGLLEEIDWSTKANAADTDPGAFKECGVGALSWANILTYDADKTPDGPKNWADFWNVEKWPGKRGMRKTAKLTMEVALMADGVSPHDVYQVIATKEGQDRAFAKLDELKPYIQWWEAGAQPQEWLSSGDVVMTTAYNGRVDKAQQEGKNCPIVWHTALAKGPTHSAFSALVHYHRFDKNGMAKLRASYVRDTIEELRSEAGLADKAGRTDDRIELQAKLEEVQALDRKL